MKYLFDNEYLKYQEIMESNMPKIIAMRQFGMPLVVSVTLLHGYELDNTLLDSRYDEYLGKIKDQQE